MILFYSLLNREFTMNYQVILPKKTLIIRGSNAHSVLEYIKSLPSFRQLSLSEQMSVKIKRASS